MKQNQIVSLSHLAMAATITLTIAMLSGCGGSIPAPPPDTTPITLVTLQGQVTDAFTGEPIVGAKLDIGSRTATTNINGRYEIANVTANSAGNVGRDYQATISLANVTSPLKMADTTVKPRYPDKKFAMPLAPASGGNSSNHDFKVGKLSATIRGVVGDTNLLPIGGITIELQDNTPGMVGNAIRSETSTPTKGEFVFANIEAGVDYKLVAHNADGTQQGTLITGKLSDNQTLNLPLGGTLTLVLSGTDTYPPRIIKVSPENSADIAPGAVNVVLTFNEPIKQDVYSIPNPSVLNNIYRDIDVSYGGKKAAGNFAHTLTWNSNFDALTINLPDTGTSSKFTVDLSLLYPAPTPGSANTLGKLKDNAGNGLEKSAVLTSGTLLAFTTNGGVAAVAPVILSPDAPGADWSTTSVMLDWQPATGARKGYNIYRSTRDNTGSVEPFVLIAGPITDTAFTDSQTLSGFNLLPRPEVAQSYVYRVTSINSDLIESAPSNEVLIKDVVGPKAVGTTGNCVIPGGSSLTITTPVTPTVNGQVQLTFSEPLTQSTAEAIANYSGTNISAAKLIAPTSVVLDFSAPIACDGTNKIIIGVGITDIAGNALTGTVTERTLTY
ncbi:MAG: hypothetical protein WCD07_03210 [Burkholderiales bacterium]